MIVNSINIAMKWEAGANQKAENKSIYLIMKAGAAEAEIKASVNKKIKIKT